MQQTHINRSLKLQAMGPLVDVSRAAIFDIYIDIQCVLKKNKYGGSQRTFSLAPLLLWWCGSFRTYIHVWVLQSTVYTGCLTPTRHQKYERSISIYVYMYRYTSLVFHGVVSVQAYRVEGPYSKELSTISRKNCACAKKLLDRTLSSNVIG